MKELGLTISGTVLYILFVILFIFTICVIRPTISPILWWILFIIYTIGIVVFGIILLKYFISKK